MKATQLHRISPSLERRQQRRAWIARILTASALLTVIAIAWPRAVRRYHEWRGGILLGTAIAFFERGDLPHAILGARGALEHLPGDAEATRIIAKSLEKIGAPEAAQWRARFDMLRPGDPESMMVRARSLLKAGYVGMAEEALASLGPTGQGCAEYHAILADIAMERRDTGTAETHWIEASRIDPGENRHWANLASVRLQSRAPGVRAAALAMLAEGRGNPGRSAEALRLLLADAMQRREVDRIREFADALAADPRATFTDRIARLNALRTIKDARSVPYLLELRDAAAGSPADLFTLLGWMNTKDLSMMVIEWTRAMPQETVVKMPIVAVLTDAYSRMGDWEMIENLASREPWGDLEYMRRAYLARALEHLDDADESKKMWDTAREAARARLDAQERLVKFALAAKWDKRAEEIMASLVALPKCPRWIYDSQWNQAAARSDTARLQKLSGILMDLDPKGIASRNNFAFLSLLTRNDQGSPHTIAENLHREHPRNSEVASTYGLSLYLRGKADEAVALMSGLEPDELRQPQVALYYAIFLFGADQPEKAAPYLELAATSHMLPEEKALLENARRSFGKVGRDREIAEAAQAARLARAAREAEADKAIGEARAARTQSPPSKDANLDELIEKRRAEKAVKDAQLEKAVRAARAAREREKAEKEAEISKAATEQKK